MIDDNPASTARIGSHPIYSILVQFPIVCFVGALCTDIAYARSADLQWANFSAWLLAAGLVMGVLAAIAGLIDFIANPRIRALGAAWPHAIGNVGAMLLALVNNLIHSRDGWTSVVPTGLILSALTVAVLLVTGWLGGTLVHRDGVGVRK